MAPLRPNKTFLQGQVRRVHHAPDGWGADVEFEVEKSAPAEGYEDFLHATPGSVLTIFTAEPNTIETGKSYTLTTSVLGGPQGERVVIQGVAPSIKQGHD